MSCLSCISLPKILPLSSHAPDDSHSPSRSNSTTEITIPTRKPLRRRPNRRRPSVLEIERAIGAGRFRDADPRELEEDKKTVFDMSTLSFPGKYEVPLMKRIRETGKWVTYQTESKFQGKWLLLIIFQWVLPIWALALLVAAGAIKLPLSTPFLDNLLM